MGTEVTCKQSLLDIASIKKKLRISLEWYNALPENRKRAGRDDGWRKTCTLYMISHDAYLYKLPHRPSPMRKERMALDMRKDHEIEYIGFAPSTGLVGENTYISLQIDSAAIVKSWEKDSRPTCDFFYNIDDADILSASDEKVGTKTDPSTLVDHLVNLFARVDTSYAACTPWQDDYKAYKLFDEQCLSGIPRRLHWMLRMGWEYVKGSECSPPEFVIFDSQGFEDAFNAACALPQKERIALWNAAVEQYRSTFPTPRLLTGNGPRDVFECLVWTCKGERVAAKYIARHTWLWGIHIIEWVKKTAVASPSIDALDALLVGLVHEYDRREDATRVQTILAQYHLPACPERPGLDMGGARRAARAAIRAGIR
ncbi:hypothetical protein HY621_01895 [Candidatus Uhrbacteria bacterium]|nr:hypothetical protein [Candidatus Uhrbacteria bacterium]